MASVKPCDDLVGPLVDEIESAGEYAERGWLRRKISAVVEEAYRRGTEAGCSEHEKPKEWPLDKARGTA